MLKIVSVKLIKQCEDNNVIGFTLSNGSSYQTDYIGSKKDIDKLFTEMMLVDFESLSKDSLSDNSEIASKEDREDIWGLVFQKLINKENLLEKDIQIINETMHHSTIFDKFDYNTWVKN